MTKPQLVIALCFSASLFAYRPLPAQQTVYSLSETTDSVPSLIRLNRAKQFNLPPGSASLEPNDPNVLPGPIHVTLRELPEIPTQASDSVLIGDLTAITPHASEDRKSLYSEYSVNVRRNLKRNPLVPDRNLITVLREGFNKGMVRMPSGRLTARQVVGYGDDLKEGQTYVFFLRYVPDLDAYFFKKVWRLHDGRLHAVWADDLSRVSTGNSAFHGVEESEFIKQFPQ
jgi:hypothetical protein